ncbi:MAG: mechanosensitive ion channel family protein [Alphaproteobacteria bacterium]|nr:MAG: mechanosensitive ion channel family protein [Alphaproteobacteria bacterium]
MEQINEFWALVVDVWKHGVYGVDVGQILVALAILLVFVALRRLIAHFIINRLKAWARRTQSEFDDEVIDALERPLSFVPVVIGVFLATQYLEPQGAAASFVGNLNRSLVAFAMFWALYRLVEPFSYVIGHLQDIFTESMLSWLIKAMKAGFVVLGGATILEIWGIAVAPLIAGLGLFGVAVALGAQDLFKNLIAGIFILGERRFQPGDWIRVEGVVEGTVEVIGFRTTRIRRFDRAPEFVPNSKLSDNVVTNFSEMTHRRIFWMIALEYRTSLDQLRQIRDAIEAYVLEDDAFAHPPEVPTFVRIDRFNDSSIDIMLYCFTRTTVWGEWLEIKERLACKIKEIVEGAGAGFAFPSQSVYVETWPEVEGRPEPIPLPEARGDTG